ncbi:MAG: hypothetical protein ACO2Z9_01355 [Crocinitomicaceae bacterium]
MDELKANIIDLLSTKAALKQDIASFSESVLDQLKRLAVAEIEDLRGHISDERVRLKIQDNGTHEFMIYVGSDVLVFQLHQNVFRMPDESGVWKTSYMQENPDRGYFGVINIYNFLAESFEQHRMNDEGYLIGRIFMNFEKHFLVEGKGQLGFLFNDLVNMELSDEKALHIIRVAMKFAIEFDLITPPYTMIQEVSLFQIQAISSDLKLSTGKRMGFKFSSEQEGFE